MNRVVSVYERGIQKINTKHCLERKISWHVLFTNTVSIFWLSVCCDGGGCYNKINTSKVK